jgi:hypothetical protein
MSSLAIVADRLQARDINPAGHGNRADTLCERRNLPADVLQQREGEITWRLHCESLPREAEGVVHELGGTQ